MERRTNRYTRRSRKNSSRERTRTSRERDGSRARSVLAAITLASTVVLVGGAGGKLIQNDTLVIPKMAVDIFVEDGADPVPSEVQSIIDTKLQNPTDSRIADIVENYNVAVNSFNPSDYIDFNGDGEINQAEVYNSSDVYNENASIQGIESQEQYLKVAQELAKEHGLSLVDVKPFLDEIEHATNLNDALGTFVEFGASLGIEIDPQPGKYLNKFRILRSTGESEDDINSHMFDEEFKDHMKGEMRRMAMIPRELYEYSNLKKLTVVQSVEVAGATDSSEGLAKTNEVFITFESLGHPLSSMVVHEFGHQLALRFNNDSVIGQYRDNRFVSLNPNGRDAYNNMNEDYSSDFARSYGSTAIEEDQATMIEYVIGGQFGSVEAETKDVLDEKVAMILGRIEQHVPGCGSYFIAISQPAGTQPIDLTRAY